MNSLPTELAQAGAFKRPPIERWQPTRQVEFDMRINLRGEWLHEGRAVRRPNLVKLFASLLRREGAQYFLITPQEKFTVQVDDAPFIAVELAVQQAHGRQTLYFRTNVDDVVKLDRDHRLSLRAARPYVPVRDGLDAKLSRPVFYELAEHALECTPTNNASAIGVWSDGEWIVISGI